MKMEEWIRKTIERIKEADRIGIVLHPSTPEAEMIIPRECDKEFMHDVAISFQACCKRYYKKMNMK